MKVAIKKNISKPTTERGYSTKYALTTGIQAVVVDMQYASSGGFVYTVANEHIGHRQQLRPNKNYFTDLNLAIANAKEQATAKLASLAKQVSRMERLAANPLLAFETKRGST